MQKVQDSMLELNELFHEIDRDESGKITEDEWASFMEAGRAKACLAKIGVDFSTSMQLFKLIDLDGSQSITITEFISGIMQLRRSAKMVDVETLLRTTKKLMTTSVAHMNAIEARLQDSLS